MTRRHAFVIWLACAAVLPALCLMQLLQALFGSAKRSVNMAIGIDQTMNALFGGLPDETISARTHRKRWKKTEAFVNWLFNDPNHCKASHESEVSGKHLPDSYKEYE